jgi:hypothetical protein
LDRDRRHSRRSSRTTLRVFALLVAAVCLSARIASFAHLLLVPHAVCPEHGELIHVGEADEHAAPAAVTRRAAHETSVSGTERADASHGHDHCTLLSDRGGQLALCPPPTALAPPPWSDQTAPACLAVRGHALSISLLLLAPKNSPPV